MISSKVGRLLEPVGPAGGWTTTGTSCRPRTVACGTSAATGYGARSRRAWSDSASIGSTSSTCTTRTSTGGGARDRLPALAELRDQGIVKAIGAGMNQSSMLADLVRETDVDVVMLAGRYTLLEQDSLDDLLPLCAERGVGVVAAGVFNSGLLARSQPPSDAKYDYATLQRNSSSELGRSPPSASGMGRPCPQPRSRFPSPTLRSSASAWAPGRRSRCRETSPSTASRFPPTCGRS